MNNKSEEENALIKRKNNIVYSFLFLSVFAFSMATYGYFYYFGDNQTLVFYSFPDFIQNFSILKANVEILAKKGEIIKANAYSLTYIFGLVFLIAVIVISFNFELITHTKSNQKNIFRISLGLRIFISLVILMLAYVVLFDKNIFVTGLSRATRLFMGTYGLAFYSLGYGAFITMLAIYISVYKLYRREAKNTTRNRSNWSNRK